jgi:uncharacterized protein
MKSRKVEDGWLLRLEKGEPVIESLTGFIREQHIPAGFITGMGAVTNATVGIYSPGKKEYIKKYLSCDLEVGNLTANIAWLEDSGEPFVHTHITLSDQSLRAITGHLFEATVLVTLEIYIRVFNQKLIRKEDPKIGFKFWEL